MATFNMNDLLKPKIKCHWKLLIHYVINEFQNLLEFTLLFSKSL